MFFSKNFHPKFYITPDVSPGTQPRGSTFNDLNSQIDRWLRKLTSSDLKSGDLDPQKALRGVTKIVKRVQIFELIKIFSYSYSNAIE